MELCAGFTSQQWQTELRPHLDADNPTMWERAIGVFERRTKERFFRCIDELLKADEARTENEIIRPGFSVMALCCLLVETLQSFYEGGRNTNTGVVAGHCTYPAGRCAKEPSTARAFKDFLKKSRYFKEDFRNSKICGDFANDVRNALLHEAETRGGWLITRTVPAERILLHIKNGYRLNRTNFYQALHKEFDNYLAELRDASQNARRENFLKKMDSICDAEPGIE
jgi:hypothetical protein